MSKILRFAATVSLYFMLLRTCSAVEDRFIGNEGASGTENSPNGDDGQSFTLTESYSSFDGDATLFARGGRGGSGFSPTGNGGDGGDVDVSISVSPAPPGSNTCQPDETCYSFTATGGDGGPGASLGTDGNAGNATIDVDFRPNAGFPVEDVSLGVSSFQGRNGSSVGSAEASLRANSLEATRVTASVAAGRFLSDSRFFDMTGFSDLGPVSASGRIVSTGPIRLSVRATGKADSLLEDVEVTEAYAESTDGQKATSSVTIMDLSDRVSRHVNVPQARTTGDLDVFQHLLAKHPESIIDLNDSEARSLRVANRSAGLNPLVRTNAESTIGSRVSVVSFVDAISNSFFDSRYTNLTTGKTSGTLDLTQHIKSVGDATGAIFEHDTRSIIDYNDSDQLLRPRDTGVDNRAFAPHDTTDNDHANNAHAETRVVSRKVGVSTQSTGGDGALFTNDGGSMTYTAPGVATLNAYGRSTDGSSVGVTGVAAGGNAPSGQSTHPGATTVLVNAVDGDTTGSMSLTQTAIGGDGLVAGGAVSHIRKINHLDYSDFVDVRTTAEAGNVISGGVGTPGVGGSASARSNISTPTQDEFPNFVATATAQPSDGTDGGAGGDAFSESNITSRFGGSFVRAVAKANSSPELLDGTGSFVSSNSRPISTRSRISQSIDFNRITQSPSVETEGRFLSLDIQIAFNPHTPSIESGVLEHFPELHEQFFDNGTDIDILAAGLLTAKYDELINSQIYAAVFMNLDLESDFGISGMLENQVDVGFGLDTTSIEDLDGATLINRFVLIGIDTAQNEMMVVTSSEGLVEANMLVDFAEPSPGDYDGNGIVDAADLSLWSTGYGTSSLGDADGDGDSDGADFLEWQRSYELESQAASHLSTVPEPGAACLLSASLILVFGSKRFRARSGLFSCQS